MVGKATWFVNGVPGVKLQGIPATGFKVGCTLLGVHLVGVALHLWSSHPRLLWNFSPAQHHTLGTCFSHARHMLIRLSCAHQVLHDCIAIVITDMPCSPHVLIADLNAAEHSQVLSHGACGVSTLCICCVKALQHDQHTALVGSERQAGNATMVMFVYKHTYC